MAPQRAFVETTVLTNAVLKPHSDEGRAARATLKRYEVTELPQYAIKEFKAGPLANMVWFHNKLATVRSFQFAIDALHSLSLSPQRYRVATALEALREAERSIASLTTDDLRREYGRVAHIDTVLSDRYRLAIKTSVLKAWKQRRAFVSSVVLSTECYNEVGPHEDAKNLLVVPERRCHPQLECALAGELKGSLEILQRLRETVDRQDKKRENQRRSQALRQLIRKPRERMTEETCRLLGDAMFAFFAPTDSVILTTNERDLGPLAAALGKKIERPISTTPSPDEKGR